VIITKSAFPVGLLIIKPTNKTKGNTMQPTLIKAYRNLTSGKISLLDQKTGLVVGHCEKVRLEQRKGTPTVKAIVNQKGRERVLRQSKKYVHAYMVGQVAFMKGFEPYKGRSLVKIAPRSGARDGRGYSTERPCIAPTINISYNPYLMSSFTNTATGAPVTDLVDVTIQANGIMRGHPRPSVFLTDRD